ncbi:MAG TPA: MFS transporter [Nevskia sp.]|nr:MFS transporter [Nevskia sp.]
MSDGGAGAGSPRLFRARLLALLAGNLVVGVNLHIVAGLLDEIARSLQVSIARAGLLISAFAIASFIGAPLFATLGSRLDRRRLLAGTMGVCALANLLSSLSPDYGSLLLSRLLAAVTSAVFTPQAAATLGVLVPERQRPAAMSFIMLGWSLAAVIGLPVGVLAGMRFGWRATMAGIAVGAALAGWMQWRCLPPRLYVPPLNLSRWLEVLRNPALMLPIGSVLALSVGNQALFSYLAPAVKRLYGAGASTVSALFLVHGIASILANVGSVLMLRRLAPQQLARFWAGACIAALALWPAPAAAASVAPVLALQLLWSLGMAGIPATQQARLAWAAPSLAAASIALNSSVAYLGQALGTTAGGLAWNLVGPRYLPWLALLPLTLGLALSLLAERRRPHPAGAAPAA